MDYLTKQKYSFVSRAPEVSKETFGVIRFSGFEAVSKPYVFEIAVVSDNPNTDPLTVLRNPAVFTIHREENEDVDFNGILVEFQETGEFNGYYFFKAVLAPKLKWLSLTHHNQVFLDSTVPQIMEAALKDAGLYPGIDFEFRLQKEYDSFEYICQYDESHFNFVSRWAEREGIYYFFEQTPNGEKAVFTDTQISHTDLLYEKNLKYHPPSGLEALHTKEVIHSFICRHNLLPQRVFLKDYNYMKPSMAIEAMADVDENGRGENYIYGLNFDTPEEGNRLARIRAEELICGKSLFNGESSVPFMVPGFTFDLKDHYKSGYNRKYLITEVTHEGHQTGYLTAGLREAVSESEEEMFYANSFTAVYSDAQFRPARKAVKPKISGTINAKIDAASSGKYAELDSHGRYKVILPFDRSGRFGGKASAWLRMMQPYAGQNQGMHFPLHKGTEVMLTFIDGDPDRPIIAGAVPNPETTSPITEKNQTKSVIKTGKSPVNQSAGAASRIGDFFDDLADNFIEIDDMNKKEHVYIRSRGDIWKEARDRYGEYHAKEYKSSLESGNEPAIKDMLGDFGGSCNPNGLLDMHNNYAEQSFDNVLKNAHVHVSSLDTVTLQKGNIYDFGGYWNYNLGNSYEENHMAQAPGDKPDKKDEANLNRDDLPKDKADKGGPNYSEIEHLAENGQNVWVTKNIKGASYEYSTEVNSLEVNHKCNSVEYKYGGKTEEYKYTGEGTPVYEMQSAKGKKTETVYNRNNGTMAAYSSQYDSGPALERFSIGYQHKNVAEFDFGDQQSFYFTGSPLDLTLNINLALATSISINKALNVSVSSFTGGTVDVSSFTGLSVSSSDYAGGKVNLTSSKGIDAGISSYTGLNINYSKELSGKIDIADTTGFFIEYKKGPTLGLEIDQRKGGVFKKKPSGGFVFETVGLGVGKKAQAVIKALGIEIKA